MTVRQWASMHDTETLKTLKQEQSARKDTKLVFFFMQKLLRQSDGNTPRMCLSVAVPCCCNLLWRRQVLFWHTPRYQQMETRSQQPRTHTQTHTITQVSHTDRAACTCCNKTHIHSRTNSSSTYACSTGLVDFWINIYHKLKWNEHRTNRIFFSSFFFFINMMLSGHFSVLDKNKITRDCSCDVGAE